MLSLSLGSLGIKSRTIRKHDPSVFTFLGLLLDSAVVLTHSATTSAPALKGNS